MCIAVNVVGKFFFCKMTFLNYVASVLYLKGIHLWKTYKFKSNDRVL